MKYGGLKCILHAIMSQIWLTRLAFATILALLVYQVRLDVLQLIISTLGFCIEIGEFPCFCCF